MGPGMLFTERMPIEPEPCAWVLPPAGEAGPDDVVALGADLEPGTLVEAYRGGLFPMPIDEVPAMVWWSPDPRGILPLDGFRLSRSLRRTRRRFTITVDRAFPAVVAGCADPARAGGWITEEMRGAYARLHALGWAHSVEAWDAGGTLAGGLYGVEVGGLFAAESKFHVRDGRLQGGRRGAGGAAPRGRGPAAARRAVEHAAPAQPRGGRRAAGGVPRAAGRRGGAPARVRVTKLKGC